MQGLAKYIFVKDSEHNTKYLLSEHFGADIPGFPGVYKIGKNKGKGYITFRPTQDVRNAQKFSHTLDLGKDERKKTRLFTGLNFSATQPRKAYGDSRNLRNEKGENLNLNHAVYIEFSEDWQKLTIIFYENQGGRSREIFDEILSGKCSVSVELNTEVFNELFDEHLHCRGHQDGQ